MQAFWKDYEYLPMTFIRRDMSKIIMSSLSLLLIIYFSKNICEGNAMFDPFGLQSCLYVYKVLVGNASIHACSGVLVLRKYHSWTHFELHMWREHFLPSISFSFQQIERPCILLLVRSTHMYKAVKGIMNSGHYYKSAVLCSYVSRRYPQGSTSLYATKNEQTTTTTNVHFAHQSVRQHYFGDISSSRDRAKASLFIFPSLQIRKRSRKESGNYSMVRTARTAVSLQINLIQEL